MFAKVALTFLFVLVAFCQEENCPPCVTRDARDSLARDVCSHGVRGVCRFIRSCQIDSTAHLGFAVPVEVRCLDSTTQLIPVSVPSSLSLTIPAEVPPAARSAGSIAALRAVLTSSRAGTIFSSESGRITVMGDRTHPRTVLASFPTFDFLGIQMIPVDFMVGVFNIRRFGDDMYLTTEDTRRQVSMTFRCIRA